MRVPNNQALKMVTLAAFLTGVAAHDANAAPVTGGGLDESAWVVGPANPGPNVPPAGRSLFDHLITERGPGGRGKYQVPFPFEALIARIEGALAPAGAYPAIKQVLIPLGRSLQRSAAGEAFFTYPRAVSAVDTPPRIQDGTSGVLLKDRLYMGYHEKAAVLEVISYNEAAARFEFQLVKDYRAGSEPHVTYANRAVCTACHQNHAPIFSRPPWEETNANPAIAARLRASADNYYGIPAANGFDIPNLIDDSTDRANRLSLAQWIWSDGCGTDRSPAAVDCRAALLTATLQYALNGGRGFARENGGFRQAARHIERHAPRGLAIPTADIPNRDPLTPLARDLAVTANVNDAAPQALRNLAHVPARFEPLNPRRPLAVLRPVQEAEVAATIGDLAGFLAPADIARIDAHLSNLHADGAEQTPSQPAGACRFQPSAREDQRWRIGFVCHGGVDAEGRFYLTSAGFDGGTLDHLSVNHERISNIEIAAANVNARGAVLELRRAGLRARTLEGNAIPALRLSWSMPADPAASFTGQARITVATDFELLHTVVDRLAAASVSGESDVLTDGPFRRAAIMPALFAGLKMEPITWCCLDTAGMPPAEADETTVNPPAQSDIPSGYARVCAHCHRSKERFPPNFLSGDGPQVVANFRQCAERIYFRLRMWDLPPDSRPKSAMPPAQAHGFLGINPSLWTASDEYKEMLDYAAAALDSSAGSKPDLAALNARGYENLHQCLH